MTEFIEPIDRVAEIDIEVRALTDQVIERIGHGEIIGDIVREEPVRKVLDYLVAIEVSGSDSPDFSDEFRSSLDETNAAWRLVLQSMTDEDRDSLALGMLEGLIDARLTDQIDFKDK